MPNSVNYVETFQKDIDAMYARELISSDFTENGARFIGTKTIKIPKLNVGGYKEHSRNGGWNRQAAANDWEVKTLAHDRDVEFYVDAMDVDESGEVLTAGNITATFEREQAIPEIDSYRFSKINSEYTTKGKAVDTTVLTAENVLVIFDGYMEAMDDAGVPQEGRLLYVVPSVETLLKNAQQIQRQINVSGSNDGRIARAVRSLDNVKIKSVPSARFKTQYDFTDGCVASGAAKQMNMMLVHPSAVIAVQKHTAIYLWAPGSHTGGDGFLYQNRQYWDLFLYDNKLDAIKINQMA